MPQAMQKTGATLYQMVKQMKFYLLQVQHQPIYTFKGVYSKIAFDVLYNGATAGERSLGIGPLGVAGFQIGEQTGTASGDTDVSSGDPFVGGTGFVFVFTDEHGVEQHKVVTLEGDGSTVEDVNHFINAFIWIFTFVIFYKCIQFNYKRHPSQVSCI